MEDEDEDCREALHDSEKDMKKDWWLGEEDEAKIPGQAKEEGNGDGGGQVAYPTTTVEALPTECAL